MAVFISSRRYGRKRDGFTLAEMVVTLAIVGLLLTGIGSAVLIASRALPAEGDSEESLQDVAAAIDILIDELRAAIWIQEHTPTSITFSVSDRDGDGNAERIRYSWDGAPGSPLMRSYNGSADQPLISTVQQLSFDYTTATVDEQYPGAPIESAEVELSSHENLSAIGDYWVNNVKFLAQYVQPALAPDVISWRVTRALVYCMQAGKVKDTLIVRLQKPGNDGYPSPDPNDTLAEVSRAESLLGASHTWETFDFDGSPSLAPGDGLYLLLLGDHNANSAKLATEDNMFGAAQSQNAGATWSYSPNTILQHYVYGKTLNPGPDVTASRTYVTAVELSLLTGGDPLKRLDTAVQTLNQPELLTGVWETDFDSDPTLDHNGDGAPDWTTSVGAPFNLPDIAGGAFTSDLGLLTTPNQNFDGLITAEIKARCTNNTTKGVCLTINADHGGGLVAPIVVALTANSSLKQTVTVSAPLAGGAVGEVAKKKNIPSGWVTVRLLIDPTADTVAVWIDDVHAATTTYTRVAETGADFNAVLETPNKTGEVDRVSIRVSE